MWLEYLYYFYWSLFGPGERHLFLWSLRIKRQVVKNKPGYKPYFSSFGLPGYFIGCWRHWKTSSTNLIGYVQLRKIENMKVLKSRTKKVNIIIGFAFVYLLLLIYILFWPVSVRPVFWQAPEDLGFTGAFEKINPRITFNSLLYPQAKGLEI